MKKDYTKYNRSLTITFWSSALLGIAITQSALELREPVFIEPGSVWHELTNNDYITYYRNHVKGLGDLLFTSQALNLFLNKDFLFFNDSKEKRQSEPLQDYSYFIATLALTSSFLGEVMDKYREGRDFYDTQDLINYAVGAALFVAINKFAFYKAEQKHAPTLPAKPSTIQIH